MTRVRYTADQRRETYAVIRSVIAHFEREDMLLASIATGAMPDGYPPTSMGNLGQNGTISDRTGSAVVTRSLSTDRAAEAFGLLHQACRLLEQADSRRHAALPRISAPPVLEGCKSCARVTRLVRAEPQPLFSPLIPDDEQHRKAWGAEAISSGLCEFCWRWQASDEHPGEWPMLEVIEARADGRRITTKLVEEALRAANRKAREKAGRAS